MHGRGDARRGDAGKLGASDPAGQPRTPAVRKPLLRAEAREEGKSGQAQQFGAGSASLLGQVEVLDDDDEFAHGRYRTCP